MTIQGAINRLDALIYNTYSQSDKVAWLSRMDEMVNRLVVDTHEGAENVIFMGYDDETPTDTVLMVPAPFDEAYLRYMEAQIHYHDGEYDRYNNAIAMFTTAFESFKDFYNRNHMPVQKGKRFLF